MSNVSADISEPPSLPFSIRSWSEIADFITKSELVLAKRPISVPESLNIKSLPPASNIISPDESKVISVPSFVIVSNAIEPTFVILKSPKFAFPPTVKSPVTVKLSPTVTSEVECPSVIAIPDVSVASFSAPVEFVKYEFEPSWYICISSPVPATNLILSKL